MKAHTKHSPAPAPAMADVTLPAVSSFAAVIVFEASAGTSVFGDLLPVLHTFGRVIHLQGGHCCDGPTKLLAEMDWVTPGARATSLAQIADWCAAHRVAWRTYSLDASAPAAMSFGELLRERALALEPSDAHSLSVFVASLAKALSEKNERSAKYFADAIIHVLAPLPAGEDVDLTELAEDAADSDQGRREVGELAETERKFFDRYQSLKCESGLNTYRKVAAAAGISVSTVQAIEDQRIKPQFRTIEKLARAFGVPVTELLGD